MEFSDGRRAMTFFSAVSDIWPYWITWYILRYQTLGDVGQTKTFLLRWKLYESFIFLFKNETCGRNVTHCKKHHREKYLGLILSNKVGVFANQLVTSSSRISGKHVATCMLCYYHLKVILFSCIPNSFSSRLLHHTKNEP